MTTSLSLRVGLFALLAALMAATRLNHFASLPDASWAVFFAAGFWLHRDLRWAFPALLALAVAVDYRVITAGGMDFWSHYCVSPGYWMLAPAYFSLFAAGYWLALRQGPLVLRPLQAVAALVVGVVLCQLLAQGGFYWLSSSVAVPTLAGWWKNYSDWLWPYMSTALVYVAVLGALHALAVVTFGRSQPAGAGNTTR